MPSLARACLPLAALALSLPAAAGARGWARGLEAPARTLRWTLDHPKSGVPTERARRTCEVYARWAVLWSDEGEMGVDDLELRARPAGMTPAQVCGAAFHGRAVRPRLDDDLVPVGVFGHWLVATGADAFGVLGTVTLLDLETGAKAYQDQADIQRELRLEPGAGGPILDYWSLLDEPTCLPRRGERACWERIRREQRLPASVPQPDCEPAVAQEPSVLEGDPARAVQITLHVRVRGLSRAAAEVLADRPRCAATP